MCREIRQRPDDDAPRFGAPDHLLHVESDTRCDLGGDVEACHRTANDFVLWSQPAASATYPSAIVDQDAPGHIIQLGMWRSRADADSVREKYKDAETIRQLTPLLAGHGIGGSPAWMEQQARSNHSELKPPRSIFEGEVGPLVDPNLSTRFREPGDRAPQALTENHADEAARQAVRAMVDTIRVTVFCSSSRSRRNCDGVKPP